MKTIVLFLMLGAALIAAPEKVVSVTNLSKVQSLLDDGWTVKSQSSTAYMDAGPFNDMRYGKWVVVHVFTLIPPPPEVLAANEARKAAEFAKARQEYLDRKAQKKDK